MRSLLPKLEITADSKVLKQLVLVKQKQEEEEGEEVAQSVKVSLVVGEVGEVKGREGEGGAILYLQLTRCLNGDQEGT